MKVWGFIPEGAGDCAYACVLGYNSSLGTIRHLTNDICLLGARMGPILMLTTFGDKQIVLVSTFHSVNRPTNSTTPTTPNSTSTIFTIIATIGTCFVSFLIPSCSSRRVALPFRPLCSWSGSWLLAFHVSSLSWPASHVCTYFDQSASVQHFCRTLFDCAST